MDDWYDVYMGIQMSKHSGCGGSWFNYTPRQKIKFILGVISVFVVDILIIVALCIKDGIIG